MTKSIGAETRSDAISFESNLRRNVVTMKSLKSPIIVRIPIIWGGEKMKNCEFITRAWIDTSKIENVGSNNSS